MDVKIFIITWLITGVISAALAAFAEYRGKNIDYISDSDGLLFFICIMCGYMSFTVATLLLLNKPICKLMYKMANMGIKKENE